MIFDTTVRQNVSMSTRRPIVFSHERGRRRSSVGMTCLVSACIATFFASVVSAEVQLAEHSQMMDEWVAPAQSYMYDEVREATLTMFSKSSKTTKTSKSKSSKGKRRPGRNEPQDDWNGSHDGSKAEKPMRPHPRNNSTTTEDPVPFPRHNSTIVVHGCIDTPRYYEIDSDIAGIAASIDNDKDRSHFFGGILRLAAHDFMDYDQNDEDVMGMDGCLDWTSLSNAGLSSLWNEHSDLHKLYDEKYSDLSRADFWVVCGNAVVRQTSDQRLDMMGTFYWGREDRDECLGSADRLPTTENCRQVEGVFLERMGLEWRDAVALLGAHTLGRGHLEFSGHHGTWMPNDIEAQVFNRGYYKELIGRSWTRRLMSADPLFQDWTTGDSNSGSPKMMLNTDICLIWDVEESESCCTRTDLFKSDGESHCQMDEDRQCDVYDMDHSRWEASEAIKEYLGDPSVEDDDGHFYEAFRVAWLKATVNGMHNLHPLQESC